MKIQIEVDEKEASVIWVALLMLRRDLIKNGAPKDDQDLGRLDTLLTNLAPTMLRLSSTKQESVNS